MDIKTALDWARESDILMAKRYPEETQAALILILAEVNTLTKEVEIMREALIYQADIHGCGLDCTCEQDDCASCCSIKALAAAEKE